MLPFLLEMTPVIRYISSPKYLSSEILYYSVQNRTIILVKICLHTNGEDICYTANSAVNFVL